MSGARHDLGRRELIRAALVTAAGAPWVGACHPGGTALDAGPPDAGPADGGTVDRDADTDAGTLEGRLAAAREVVEAYFAEAGPEAIRRLGNTYLDRALTFPRLPAVVEALLSPTLDLVESYEDTEAAVVALRDQVVADFRALELVTLGGWVTSRTEMHLSAMLALLG